MSLADVAVKAEISAATLSRIERDKQALDLGLFLVLASVFNMPPSDFFDGREPAGENSDPLVAKITTMMPRERTALWRNLTEEVTKHRRTVRPAVHALTLQVEELLAQVEYLRTGVESVQKNLKRR